MPRHSETKYLPYTPEQLFELVSDVARYDEFLPWVVAVRIRSSSEQETIADLVVGFNAFKERFTSRVRKERPVQICVDYVEGPLKFLHNEWRFDRAEDGGTNLYFSVDVAFGPRKHDRADGLLSGSAPGPGNASYGYRHVRVGSSERAARHGPCRCHAHRAERLHHFFGDLQLADLGGI